MKTILKSYGCTATITEKSDGNARLVVTNQHGMTVKDSTHKSRAAALAAWRRFST